MDKYINVAEIAFAFKEEEVAAQYGGKNDITTGILFALDTLELDMPESIVRCKECRYRSQYSDENGMYHCGGIDTTKDHALPVVAPDDFCSYGERRSDD